MTDADVLRALEQGVLNARAARFTRGPRGGRLTPREIEHLVGEVHVRINDLLDRLD